MCRGQRREETFENVLRNPLTFPSKPAISPEAQDLISKLLIKDPLQRLGTQVQLSGLRSCSQPLCFMPV
jgi:serine/threonine protein kinase